MPGPLDQILNGRLRRVSSKQQTHYFMASFAAHVGIALGLWLAPGLFAKPPEVFDAVDIVVVPPAVLGTEEPQPEPSIDPPPPTPEPPPPEPPPPEPPAPEPVPSDRPVLVEEAKKPKPEVDKPPPPEPRATPPPPRRTPPPKRQGSPFGNPMGAQSRNTVIGVEDPNFTYGYYLDRVVGAISRQWRRPLVGSEVKQAVLYFRVQKDGSVTDIAIRESSGAEIFDTTALKAVEAAAPLPPLPKSYKPTSGYLGINLIIR